MFTNITPKAIAVDSSGNIYIAGNAIVDLATSQTAVLVAKLNPELEGAVYSICADSETESC